MAMCILWDRYWLKLAWCDYDNGIGYGCDSSENAMTIEMEKSGVSTGIHAHAL